MLKHLVVTADDFGLAAEVNEAVEAAHRTGILSAASLMVAEPFVADAVARARQLPGLRVGLHLTLVEGRPMLPRTEIPDLVAPATGRLRTDMARLGLEIVAKRSVRRQVAAEITAQFEAFGRTGLRLDHVNAHKHYHLHPVIAGDVIRIGRDYGMAALRVPVEPASVLARIQRHRRPGEAVVAGPWAKWLRRRARRAGLIVPDAVFGLAWSGRLTEERLVGLLAALPPGLTEIYSHPAVRGGFEGSAAGYRYAEELAALLAPATAAALRASGATLGGYADFA